MNDQIKEGFINNGDEVANPGEEISLDIKIRNVTKQTLKDVTVHFLCDSEVAEIISEPKKIGDLPSAYYASGYSGASKSSNVTLNAAISKTCVLKLSQNLKANRELPITVFFTDSTNNIWTDTFNIPIQYSDFKVFVPEIECVDSDKDDTKNNNDGFIQPGETLFMDLKLHNAGKSGAVGIKAKLIALSDYITIKKGEADFYNLATNCYKTGNYVLKYGETSNGSKNSEIAMDGEKGTVFVFEVSPSTPKGIEIPMQIEITDFSGNLIKKHFSIFIDDYEEVEEENEGEM